jgi:hypothetical protein
MRRSTLPLLLLFLSFGCQQQTKVPEGALSPAEEAATLAKAVVKKDEPTAKKPEAPIPETCGNGQVDTDESCDGREGMAARQAVEKRRWVFYRGTSWTPPDDCTLHRPDFSLMLGTQVALCDSKSSWRCWRESRPV